MRAAAELPPYSSRAFISSRVSGLPVTRRFIFRLYFMLSCSSFERRSRSMSSNVVPLELRSAISSKSSVSAISLGSMSHWVRRWYPSNTSSLCSSISSAAPSTFLDQMSSISFSISTSFIPIGSRWASIRASSRSIRASSRATCSSCIFCR